MFPKLPRFLNVVVTVALVFELAMVGLAVVFGVFSLHSHDWLGAVAYAATTGFAAWQTERSWTRVKNYHDGLEERS